MPWFICDSCGDSIKKPSLLKHMNQCCGSQTFTCIDCSATFDRYSVQNHNQCVTEHQKYAEGATKPGGFASQGFSNGQPSVKAEAEATGIEFLSTRPPWRCSACNIGCTSQETLQAHASGLKHKRRVRTALGLNVPQQKGEGGLDSKAPRPSKPPPSPSTSSSSLSSSDDEEEESHSSKLPLDEGLINKLITRIQKKLKLKGKLSFKLLIKMVSKLEPKFKDSSIEALTKVLAERKAVTVKNRKLLPFE